MNNQQTTKRARFVSLRVKILVGFTMLFTVVFAGAFYWFNSFSETMALKRIEEDLKDTLLAAAGGVNGDELASLVKEGVPNEEGFSDDPRYQRQIEWLDTVHNIEPRAWPYTYVKGEEEKEVICVADAWVRHDPKKAIKFQERYTPNTYIPWQGLDDTTLYMKVYTDTWGSWVSGYTPIKDAQGEKVGAIGVDFRADYVDQVKQAIRDSMVMAFGITYAVLFALVFLVSGTLTRPVVFLTRAAERIGEGDYSQDLSELLQSQMRDEISTLTEVFEIMVGKVRKREQTLRRQVEELRIEIDEVKRRKQVSEIVDTDFFQELQARARSMRDRSRQSGQQDKPDEGTP